MKQAFSIASLLMFSALNQAHALTVKQTTMLETLEQVISVFSEEYAPFDYKIKSANYDLAKEAANARSKIENTPSLTTPEFQDILTDLLSATRDFHVSVSFLSTEAATLPFQVMSTEGRYFVIYIDHQKLPAGSIPGFEIGTEILEFNGKPTVQAVRELVPQRYKEPSATELRLAEMNLTMRSRASGIKVPSGEILLKTRDHKTDQVRNLAFTWEYTPEYVPNDMPLRNMLMSPDLLKPEPKLELDKPLNISGEPTLVPTLGPVLGVNTSKEFNSYLFRLPKGKVVGYIRIPTFHVAEPAKFAAAFSEIIQGTTTTTDGLVIDITHNGGGSFFYMAALLSHLTAEPLKMPPQRILVSQRMAAISAHRVALADLYHTEADLKKLLGVNWDGLETHFELFQSLINNDRFLLSEVRAGRRLTNPTFLEGLSFLPPAAVHYDKPILIITDELDFSCADFFPAILQDNKRVTILGQRTAGAGGSVREITFPNQFGIDQLHYTTTIATRADGSPLEGVGVDPDVKYVFTINDLRNGFADYKNAIVAALEKILN